GEPSGGNGLTAGRDRDVEDSQRSGTGDQPRAAGRRGRAPEVRPGDGGVGAFGGDAESRDVADAERERGCGGQTRREDAADAFRAIPLFSPPPNDYHAWLATLRARSQ